MQVAVCYGQYGSLRALLQMLDDYVQHGTENFCEWAMLSREVPGETDETAVSNLETNMRPCLLYSAKKAQRGTDSRGSDDSEEVKRIIRGYRSI